MHKDFFPPFSLGKTNRTSSCKLLSLDDKPFAEMCVGDEKIVLRTKEQQEKTRNTLLESLFSGKCYIFVALDEE